jgi:predicted nuclease of predicted toxin-antitoxin system
MRILLDENLDWRLRRHLPGHEVDTVAYIGWSGVTNGTLLRQAAAAGYDVLVTLDGNLSYQQNLASHGIAVIALRAASNRLADTLPLVPQLLACLPGLVAGQVLLIG